MTLNELLLRLPPQTHINRGEVFFNTRFEEVASEWLELGATLKPWYTEEEYAAQKFTPLCEQGWEVHVLGTISPRHYADYGEGRVDITAPTLIAALRERSALSSFTAPRTPG